MCRRVEHSTWLISIWLLVFKGSFLHFKYLQGFVLTFSKLPTLSQITFPLNPVFSVPPHYILATPPTLTEQLPFTEPPAEGSPRKLGLFLQQSLTHPVLFLWVHRGLVPFSHIMDLSVVKSCSSDGPLFLSLNLHIGLPSITSTAPGFFPHILLLLVLPPRMPYLITSYCAYRNREYYTMLRCGGWGVAEPTS